MADPTSPRFPLLRAALRAVGLAPEKVDQVVQFIVELLSEDQAPAAGPDLGAFKLRDDFLSPAEKSFFLVLRGVIGADGEVLAKIRLGDLFYPSRGDYGARAGLRNRVDRKHVDFLVCHPKTFEPWFGVELDDSSHAREDRKERDDLVNKVFAAAGLPLMRFAVRTAYAPGEVEDRLIREAGFQRIATSSPPAPAASAERVVPTPSRETDTSARPCPKCESPMVLRTARSGDRAGNRFWGCSNYPRCRAVVDV